MNYFKRILLNVIVSFSTLLTFAQVGIGTQTPETSAALDITSDDKALLITRLTDTSVVTKPIDGMLIYDMSAKCIKFYEDGAWTDCVPFDNPASNSDPIRSALSVSVQAYDDAAINNLVPITKAEYDNMMNIVPGNKDGGTQDQSATPGGLGGETWAVNGDGIKYKNIEKNSYVYGYAFGTFENNPNAYFRLGVCSAVTAAPTAITNYSGPFNIKIGYNYFAVKRPNINSGNNTIFVSSNTGQTGGYKPSDIGQIKLSTTSMSPSESGIPTPTDDFNFGWLTTVHFKYSTQKSW